jgi:hypothetical protein
MTYSILNYLALFLILFIVALWQAAVKGFVKCCVLGWKENLFIVFSRSRREKILFSEVCSGSLKLLELYTVKEDYLKVLKMLNRRKFLKGCKFGSRYRTPSTVYMQITKMGNCDIFESSLVSSLGLSGMYKRFFFCLGCFSRPSTKLFFPNPTLFHFLCPHLPASWAGSRAGPPVS